MLRIVPITDRNELQRYNEEQNQTSDYGYSILQNGQVLGYCLFSIEGDMGVIQCVNTKELSLFDGVVRAVLAFMQAGGIDKASFLESIDDNMLEKLRFVSDTSRTVSSIEGFFSQRCDG